MITSSAQKRDYKFFTMPSLAFCMPYNSTLIYTDCFSQQIETTATLLLVSFLFYGHLILRLIRAGAFPLCACALKIDHEHNLSLESAQKSRSSAEPEGMGFTAISKSLVIVSLLVGLQLVRCQVHFDCPQLPPLTQPAKTIHELRPQDIKVVMALGDSITAGTSMHA